MLTKEELLRPRYKVIQTYPASPFMEGEICSTRIGNNSEDLIEKYCTSSGNYWFIHPTRYPHLFRRLEWWEEREESELPRYLKVNTIVVRVDEYFQDRGGWFSSEGFGYYLGGSTPATEQEYLDYIKTKPC